MTFSFIKDGVDSNLSLEEGKNFSIKHPNDNNKKDGNNEEKAPALFSEIRRRNIFFFNLALK